MTVPEVKRENCFFRNIFLKSTLDRLKGVVLLFQKGGFTEKSPDLTDRQETGKEKPPNHCGLRVI
jgi:hypothetical protein